MRVSLVLITAFFVLLTSSGFGDVLFLHHFDNLSAATPQERLRADFAKGDPWPFEYRPVADRPDTTSARQRFGGGALKRRGILTGGRDVLTFRAKDNVSLQKGSVEGWVYIDVDDIYTSRWGRLFSIIVYGQPAESNTAVFYEKIEVRLNSMWWAMEVINKKGAPTGTIRLLEDPLNAEVKKWVHIAADWKLDSDVNAENFIRLWVDGFCIGTANNIPKFVYTPGEGDCFGLLGDNVSNTIGIQGYGDEVRITNMLITDLYETNEYNDFDVPSAPFATPDITTCADALKYGLWNLQGDLDSDCHIGIGDVAKMAEDWLK